MIFTALGERLRQQGRASDPVAQVEAQLELGLDAVVDLSNFSPQAVETGHADAPGLPVRFAPQVRTRQWAQIRLLAGGWGVGGDALAWFCGLQQAVLMAMDEPEFFAELLGLIAAWNRPRMLAYLDFGVDLFVRRAWYEGVDFWSPALFRQFFLPILHEEVDLAHRAGARYGYLLTSGSMPLHDQLLELGIDALIGPDWCCPPLDQHR